MPVCFYGLFLSQQDYTKSTKLIPPEPGGGTGNRLGKNSLNLEAELNRLL